MAGFDNGVVYGSNVDFTGTTPVSGQINLDGELLVGASVAPFIRSHVPTGSGNLTVTTGPGTIDFGLSGPITPTSYNANGVLLGQGTNPIVSIPPSTLGTLFQSLGPGVNPGWTTATYPSTTTINQILYSSAANTITGLATANNGTLVTSSTGVPSILAGPGVTGKILQSNAAAAPSFSTATYPSTATGTGTILRADGTNWSATTATYPNTTTVSQILYSSSTNVIGGITTANNSIVLTDGSGVPSLGTSLTNDFTYTSSTAGGTRTLTVTNTDNTNAASKALVQLTTGGTSSGDALTTYSVTGSSSWSIGIDNSDTQAMVISGGTALGTNNVMRINGNGEINFPLQSAFLANHSGTQTDVTGDGTGVTITWGTEIFDQNADFASNTFTAPITGRYYLCTSVFAEGLLSTHTAGTMNIVTSNRTYQFSGMSWAAARSATNYILTQAAQLADMDAADTATVSVVIANGTKVVDFNGTSTNSFFAGYLAC